MSSTEPGVGVFGATACGFNEFPISFLQEQISWSGETLSAVCNEKLYRNDRRGQLKIPNFSLFRHS